MRRKLVVGNWKMHGSIAGNKVLLDEVVAEVQKLHHADYVVCVPYPYFAQTRSLLQETNIGWGGQDVCQFDEGAFTGAVAPHMLADFGCTHVIVGHSERRSLFHESDTLVAAKFEAAINAKLKPIFCVGETLDEREAGVTEAVVARQLDAVINRTGVQSLTKAVVAYEPVWAIGTGKTATPEQAQAVHAFIRNRVAESDPGVAADLPILYGGSVKAANVGQLFTMLDIDGGLIGGASLVAREFVAICRAAN